GPKRAGTSVSITVTFSEEITTVGSPSLAMNTGGTATCSEASAPPKTLICTYVVRDSDTDGKRLDYASRNALTGTITDVAGNVYLTTYINNGFPTVGTANDGLYTANVTVDTTRPTVTSVSAASRTYYVDMLVPISVTFSEAVKVEVDSAGGSLPNLTVCLDPPSTCSARRTATYLSGSGTAVLSFSYKVLKDDSSAALELSSTSALSGGIITDVAGNPAQTSLPGSLGSSGAKIDGVSGSGDNGLPPSVLSVSSSASGTYRSGQVIPINITFTEPVLVSGVPTLELNTGTSVSYTSGTGTATLTFNYVVGSNDSSNLLNYSDQSSLKLGTNAAITDFYDVSLTPVPGDYLPLTTASNSLRGSAISIDTKTPSLSISYSRGVTVSLGSPPVLNTGAVTLTITSDEDLAGAPVISINQPGTTDITNATTLGTVPGKTFTYVYTVTLQTGTTYVDGTAAVTVVGSDGAGNSTTATSSFITDTVTPAVSRVSTTLAGGTYGVGTVVQVDVTFSKAVTVTGTPQLTLKTGASTTTTVNYFSGSGTSVLSFNYTVQPGDSSADLNYVATTSLVAAGGLIQDRAGTNATLTLPALAGATSLAGTSAIVVETILPTVQSVSAPSGAYLQDFSVPISVKFSEPVTVTSGTPALGLANGGSASYASGAGTDTLVFTYLVASSNSFASDLNYPSTTSLTGLITDLPGNPANLTLPATASANSLSGTSDVIVDSSRKSSDRTPPTVDPNVGVSTTKAAGSYGVGSTIPVTVTFTENVVVTGLPTLAIDTGRSSPTLVAYTSGSGTAILTFTYTVAANDSTNGAPLNYASTSALTLPSGATIKDQSGNAGVLTLPDLTSDQALSSKGIVIDTVAPTFAITYTAATFTGSINGTALAITALSSGAIAVGQVISCAPATPACGIVPGTTIVSGVAPNWLVDRPYTPAIPSGTQLTASTPATAVPTFKAGTITITATSSKALATAPSISINQQGTTDIASVAMSGAANGTVFTYPYAVTAATGGTYIDGIATVAAVTA
ncbi:MAG: hypothetical protein EBT09_06475, partial [Actinobacteria bacterium]|nr:hypothetical protein [Actinomycetota bacterium]